MAVYVLVICTVGIIFGMIVLDELSTKEYACFGEIAEKHATSAAKTIMTIGPAIGGSAFYCTNGTPVVLIRTSQYAFHVNVPLDLYDNLILGSEVSFRYRYSRIFKRITVTSITPR